MDSFDYDCFAAVDQFCNIDNLDQEMKKVTETDPIDLSDDDIVITSYEKKEFYEIGENDEPTRKVTLSPRRVRTTTRNARYRNADIVDLTSIEVPSTKIKKKNSKKSTTSIDLDDTLGITISDFDKNNSILSDTDPDQLTINVQWDNKIEKLPHRKYQKFSELMEIFSKRENCSINDILLNMDQQVISPDDTPHSIDYKFYDIICGRVVPNCNNIVSESVQKNKNLISLKIQSSNWKKPMEISIEKNEEFSILVAKLAEELKLKNDDFILIFDGEKLDPCETPNDLDFEDGELIDCKIKVLNYQNENTIQPKKKANVRKSRRRR